MTLSEKVASRFLAGNVVQDGAEVIQRMEVLKSWVDQMVLQKDSIDVLWAKGSIRSTNATKVPPPTPIPELAGNLLKAVHAQVKSSTGGTYETHISFLPKRSHRCNCPDWVKRAKEIGPCKHVLALGEAWETKMEYVLKHLAGDLALVNDVVLDNLK